MASSTESFKLETAVMPETFFRKRTVCPVLLI